MVDHGKGLICELFLICFNRPHKHINMQFKVICQVAIFPEGGAVDVGFIWHFEKSLNK